MCNLHSLWVERVRLFKQNNDSDSHHALHRLLSFSTDTSNSHIKHCNSIAETSNNCVPRAKCSGEKWTMRIEYASPVLLRLNGRREISPPDGETNFGDMKIRQILLWM